MSTGNTIIVAISAVLLVPVGGWAVYLVSREIKSAVRRPGKSNAEAEPLTKRASMRVSPYEPRQPTPVARILVMITLVLWFLLFLIAVQFARTPSLALIPLAGLYPGAVTSGEPNYNPVSANIWMGGAGIVFVALAVIGLLRRSWPAATAFLILFVVSTAVFLVRLVSVLEHLH